MTPSEIILRKNLVTSAKLTSEKWSELSAAVRDRAFFSSRVESVRFLETCRTRLAELMDAAKNADGAVTSRAQVVSDIMKAARDSGIATGKGGLTDPGSVARANVIIDTNAGLAAGYAAAEQANTFGARLAFPAQELVRIEERQMPRNWQVRWRAAGGRFYSGGDRPTAGGRMIALKDDPIWVAISRFGQPYPPFDFNSGMGLDDISYDEAVSLGVIKPDYQPPEKSPLKSFNEGLEAELKISRTDDPYLAELQGIFGEDQIKWNPTNKTIGWEGGVIRDTLHSFLEGNTKGKKKPDLGRACPKLLELAPELKDKHLRASGSSLKHIYDEHVLEERDKRGIKMDETELEHIGRVWRQPDSCERGEDGALVLVKESSDRNQYRLVVQPEKSGGVTLKSFHKKNMHLGDEPTANKGVSAS